jgi:hypothetical protein
MRVVLLLLLLRLLLLLLRLLLLLLLLLCTVRALLRLVRAATPAWQGAWWARQALRCCRRRCLASALESWPCTWS